MDSASASTMAPAMGCDAQNTLRMAAKRATPDSDAENAGGAVKKRKKDDDGFFEMSDHGTKRKNGGGAAAKKAMRAACRSLYGTKWYECSADEKRKRMRAGTAVANGSFAAKVDEQKVFPCFGMSTLLWHDNAWVMIDNECGSTYMEPDVTGHSDPWYLMKASLRNNCQGMFMRTWRTTPLELYIEKSAWVKLGPDGQRRARNMTCPCCLRAVRVIHTNAHWPGSE